MNILFKFLQFLPSKKFELGYGHVTRYTLIEIKWLFSIYIHHIATFGQDRFHTHAFNAVVYCLSGSYTDIIKDGIGLNKNTHINKFTEGSWRYIPRSMNHKIVNAENDTISLLLTGPYSNLWTEELDDETFRLLTNGRIPVYEIKMNH